MIPPNCHFSTIREMIPGAFSEELAIRSERQFQSAVAFGCHACGGIPAMTYSE